MAGTTRVKWAVSDIARVGRAALALALEHRPAVEPRLAPGVLDGLAADLDAFEGKRSDAARAGEGLRAATRSQDEAARRALDFLSVARGAVARNGATASQRASFGLKLRPNANKVSTIVAGLDAFLDGSARFAGVVRSAGLLPADLDRARALRAALVSADAAQETQKEKRKSPTAERRELQARIEAAIDSVITAGQLEFLEKPAIGARFKALVPGSGARRTGAGPATTPA